MYTTFLFRKKNYNFPPSWKIIFLIPLFLTVISLIHCTSNHQPQNPEAMSESSLPSVPKPPITHSVQNLPLPQPIQGPQPASPREPLPSVPSPIKIQKPTKIRVDLSTQQLQLYDVENQLLKSYPISTSKYGIGNQAGSNKTPLGLHEIKNKIGEGASQGTIFKGRVNTKKLAKINEETEDVVTSRIMWLKGLEKGKNAGTGIDSYQRCIYIHGTAAEKDIGKPASHGCVRMFNQDVIELFDLVEEGLQVEIFCSLQEPSSQECLYGEQVTQKMKEDNQLTHNEK